MQRLIDSRLKFKFKRIISVEDVPFYAFSFYLRYFKIASSYLLIMNLNNTSDEFILRPNVSTRLLNDSKYES
jgi:hypothetical protein